MTRTTKKTIAFIVGATFIAALVCFFAFATSGFKNWDASKWFDYWGKGKPAVKTTVKDQSETNVKAASNAAGLTYDSEDAVVTVNVVKYNKPIVKIFSQGLAIITRNNDSKTGWGDYLRFGISDKPGVLYFESFAVSPTFPASVKNVCELPFSIAQVATLYEKATGKHYDEADFYGVPFYYEVWNEADDNGLESDHTKNSVPAMFVEPVTPVIDGTVLRVDQPKCVEMLRKEDLPYSVQYDVAIMDCDVFNNANCVDTNVADLATQFNLPEGVVNVNPKMPIVRGMWEFDLCNLSFVTRLLDNCTVTVRSVLLYVDDECEVNPFIKDIHFSITQLSVPYNVRLDYASRSLTWDAVDGAQGYYVDDGKSIKETVTDNRYSFVGNSLEVGEHTFRIRALGNVGSQLAAEQSVSLSAYNASLNIQQLVVLNYKIENDIVSKFVPLDDKIGDYLYGVKIKNKTFGGWYYDSGYTRKVDAADRLNGDMTIYARLMDVKVTERPLTWWEQNKWYVLVPCFVLVAVGVVVGGVLYAKKRKAK